MSVPHRRFVETATSLNVYTWVSHAQGLHFCLLSLCSKTVNCLELLRCSFHTPFLFIERYNMTDTVLNQFGFYPFIFTYKPSSRSSSRAISSKPSSV